MQKKIQNWIRIVLLLCGIALVVVLFVPMWGIDLVAPQYPEGLRLLIYPNKLSGNVDIINGLNHYIGMKTLHTSDFIEFAVLPYIIAFFSIAFFITAIIQKRKILNLLFVLFVLFGVLAMYDFWRWEYNYGHNLNPDAAIIVPGMAYQPPLIGFKQLLNFGAYSMPDIGGWIFIGVGVLLFLCVFAQWRIAKRRNVVSKKITTAVVMILLIGLSSCNTEPVPLVKGKDNCFYCKMTISDVRFGAEVVTTKGKIYKFDDMHCIISFLQTKTLSENEIANIYVANFCGNHSLLNIKRSSLLKSVALKSPMGGNIGAFDNTDSLKMIQQQYTGVLVNWSELIK